MNTQSITVRPIARSSRLMAAVDQLVKFSEYSDAIGKSCVSEICAEKADDVYSRLMSEARR